ncbi:ABC transporter ATP-binding protein [Mycoplasmopsis anatis]|uniref:ABC transporter ATP-binding protein n=1 Tax=Mycoplasmopsis anatis TaxID=171279 RepID=A0A9Q3L9G3_9BACT|nr:ABC transporter ATP-binding protein [Mycoplasmopsis anatis]MBW0594283.1 ABC transporter ATP-binding protein [Mycoplasmopsis anatis]MBW0595106.1 ABC transporter ATP-binding protein [Mycoplasmopsis anatis]MBW0596400.1 ABC transporter ATP-binding protein [Mycoplasmopsis anatis]MBW0596516.1 ABC transporter ATP-binding protein [Mycoplasmopsis anatis]MBW0597858.1 ABC transporter ATP-binding protein [Mycoplasmopsis anatis]
MKSSSSLKTFLRMIYAAKVKPKAWMTFITFAFVKALSWSAIGFGTGWILDRFFSKENIDNFDLTTFLVVLIVFLLVYLIHRTFVGLTTYFMTKITTRFEREMRGNLYRHIQEMSFFNFETEKTGDFMAVVTEDTVSAFTSMNSVLLSLCDFVFDILLSTFWMMLLAPILGLITYLIIPPVSILFIYLVSKSRKQWKKSRDAFGALNAYLEETLDILPLVRVHRQWDKIQNKFDQHNNHHREVTKKAFLYQTIAYPAYSALKVISELIIIIIGITFITKSYPSYGIYGVYTIGVVTSFNVYGKTFTNSISNLLNISAELQQGISSWDRIENLLKISNDKEDKKKPNLEFKEGKVEFRSVNFAYPSNLDVKVLKDINFTINPGESLALVGHTGCGKTTISKILMKFYETNDGQVLIDNQNAIEYNAKSWRENIALISQDVMLFEDTLMNNIKNSNKNISEEKVIQICREIGLDEYIQTLKDKYNTKLTHNAEELSQGQRQLVSIARALASEKKLIIMDEATSNIDSITEQKIQNCIKLMMKDKTMLIIAHRLSTIKKATNILVMDHGLILESGNHEELLAKNGIYANLYNEGFKNIG